MDTPTLTFSQSAPADLDSELWAALGDARSEDWLSNREPYSPTVTRLTSDSGDAAVLTSSRPNTRYTKVVDVWATTDAAARAALERVIENSRSRADAAVKWQLPAGAALPAFAAGLGFAPLDAPIASAPGTEGVDGFALWHTEWPHRQLPYYGQTTEFTCGAVAALIAATALEAPPFDRNDKAKGREREFAFWRQATNFPASEPLGVAVALHDEVAPFGISLDLHLDTTSPVLLEHYAGDERNYRELLQAESRRQAERRGIPLHPARIGIDEVTRRIAGGELALLLIDEAPMHDASVPHWVVGHAVHGDTVLIQDPWITADRGETWVDSHDLPLSVDVLDGMLEYGDPGYRGVIFVRRG